MRKPKCLLAAALLLPFVLPAAEPMTNQQVIQLVKNGTGPEELCSAIAAAPRVIFNLMPTDMDFLMRAGVSEDAIKVMAARQNGPTPEVASRPVTGQSADDGWVGPTNQEAAGFLLQLLSFGVGWRYPRIVVAAPRILPRIVPGVVRPAEVVKPAPKRGNGW